MNVTTAMIKYSMVFLLNYLGTSRISTGAIEYYLPKISVQRTKALIAKAAIENDIAAPAIKEMITRILIMMTMIFLSI